MKKIIVSALGVISSACCLLGLASCQGEDLLNVQLPQYEAVSTSVFEDTYDRENVKLDGVLDDACWEGKKWLYHKGNEEQNVRVEYTTAFDEYGVYFAGVAYDPDITWYGSYDVENNSGFSLYLMLADNTEKRNTAIMRLHVDAYDRKSHFQSRFSAGTKVEGEIDSGESVSMTTEMFVSWKALNLTTKDTLPEEEIPEAVKIEPVYRKRITYDGSKKRDKKLVFPTFTEPGQDFILTWFNFGAEGYINADEADAYMGMAKNGIAKTDGWDTSSYKTDGTVRSTRVSNQAIFYKEVDAENFVAKATVRSNGVLGTTGSPQFGMIASQSFEACRAVYVSHNTMDSDKLVVNTMTYYPNRSRAETFGVYNEAHEFGETVELEYLKYGDEIFFLVDGILVYTDKQTWYAGAFSPGLYTYGCDAVFSELSAEEKTTAEMEEYLISNGITRISVSSGTGGSVTTDAYAVHAGNSFELTVKPGLGYILSELTVNGDDVYGACCENISNGKYAIETDGQAQTLDIVAAFTKFSADNTNRYNPISGKLISSSNASTGVANASIMVKSSYDFLYYEDTAGPSGDYYLDYLPAAGTLLTTINGKEISADGKYTVTFSAPFYRTLVKEYTITSDMASREENLTMENVKGKAVTYDLNGITVSSGNGVTTAEKTAQKDLPSMIQYSTKAENATSSDGLDQWVFVVMRASVSDFSEFVSLQYTVYEENSTAMIVPVVYDRDGSAFTLGGSSIVGSKAIRTNSAGETETRTASNWQGISVAGNAYATYTVAFDEANVWYWEARGLANDDGALNRADILHLVIAIYANKSRNYTVSFGDVYGVKADGSKTQVFDAANATVLNAERGKTSNTTLNTGVGQAKLFFFAPASSSTNTVNYQVLSKTAARTVTVEEGLRTDMWKIVEKTSGDVWQSTSNSSEETEYVDLTYHDAVSFNLNTSEMTMGKTLSMQMELRCGNNGSVRPRPAVMYLIAEDGTLTEIDCENGYFALPAGFKGTVVVLFKNFDYYPQQKLSGNLAKVENTIRFITKVDGLGGELFKIDAPQFISNGTKLVDAARKIK